MIHGFVIIDKPAGITSHDVVAQLRRVARQKRVGHAGTLDPAATGVLVTALGNATRLIEYVQDATSKRYLAEVRLGITTSTDDAEGETLASSAVPTLGEAALEQALGAFRGPIEQVPPMYSALHHEGRRLHELAREGITVERAARPVTIERLELLAHTHDTLTLDVLCSKGTYIRSLARDLGAALGCGAAVAGETALGAGAALGCWAPGPQAASSTSSTGSAARRRASDRGIGFSIGVKTAAVYHAPGRRRGALSAYQGSSNRQGGLKWNHSSRP